MAEPAMRIAAGTSGYAYKEWKPSFYPPDIKPDGFLRYYASRFATVEINATFYRMPTEKTLLSWADEVPASFVFVLKASQKITHQKRLKAVADELQYFVKTASVLGPRLGPTLFQLPPNFRKDLPRLLDFLALLPTGYRAAFEFRHASWLDAETFGALRAHGAALCLAETDPDESALTIPVEPTADWGYLRLRRAAYSDADLAAWIARIRAQPWRDVFVFFKHEDAGTGPRLAAAFLDLWEKG